MNFYRLSIISLTFLFSINSFTQSLIPRPKCLNMPVQRYMTGSILMDISGPDPSTPIWPVYALADNTVGYSDEALQGRAGNYNYLDLFYVIQEMKYKVRVVPGEFVVGGRLTGNWLDHTCYFPKTSLLLWSQSIIRTAIIDNEPAELNAKGMVINNIYDPNFTGRPGFYKGPDSSYTMIEKLGLFKVQYVYYDSDTNMTEEDDRGKFVLLGIFPSIGHPSAVKSTVKGWVGKKNVQTWNHQLMLESDWSRGGWRESSDNLIKIFTTRNIQNYSSNSHWRPPSGTGFELETEPPFYKDRAMKFYHKFPLLSDSVDLTTDVPKVGVVGDINIGEGIVPRSCIPTRIDAKEYDKIELKVMNGYSDWRQVNIIFVVDATFSMEQYLNPIQRALKETMTSIIKNNPDPSISYRFGAVIYRDCREMENTYNVFNGGELSGNIESLISFFTEYMNPNLNKNDLDQPEAVFLGIHEALTRYNIKPLNTNYLILIGDAGNNYSSPCNSISKSQIISELSSKNFHLLFYQMHDIPEFGVTYQQFRDDCQEIIKSVTSNRNQKYRSLYNNFLQRCDSLPYCELGRKLGGFTTDTAMINFIIDQSTNAVREIDPEQSPIIGRFWPSPENDSISGHQLKMELDTALTRISRESLLIENDQGTISEGDNVINRRTMRTVSRLMDFGLSLNEIVIYLSDKQQVYSKGYTVYRPLWNNSNPAFNYIVFLSNPKIVSMNEFFQLTIRPDQLPQSDQLRRDIYNVWREIFINQLGLIPNVDALNGTRIGRILSYITGLPSPVIYSNHNVSDLFNTTQFHDSLLYRLSIDFILANGRLKCLSQNRNEMTYSYFRSYRYYILEFLRLNNINILDLDGFMRNLETYYKSESSKFNLNQQKFPVYPFYTPDETHPNIKNNWYYFVDARYFPSSYYNLSQELLNRARSFQN